MTYFRNARDKYDADLRGTGEKKPNPYYEGYLSDADKDVLSGYDFCVEQAENTLFNLIQYDEELSKVGFYVDKVDEHLLADFWHSDTAYESYEPYKLEEATVETKLLMILMEHMHCELESERDMLVTSMIDNMDDEEYKKNYKAVWGKEPEDGDSE